MSDDLKKASREFQASVMEGFKPDPEWVEGFMEAGQRNYEHFFGPNGERDPGLNDLAKEAAEFEAHVKQGAMGKLIGPEYDNLQLWWFYRLSVPEQTPLERFHKGVEEGVREMAAHVKKWTAILERAGVFPKVREATTWVTPSRHGLELSAGIEFTTPLTNEQYDKLHELTGL